MAIFPACYPQPHVPVEASGNMTDLSMHSLWPDSIFFVNAKRSLNIRFIGIHILFGAFMAKDSWHGVIWKNFLLSALPKLSQRTG